MREHPRFKTIPILILTTESSDQMKQAGRNAGATGWLVKPFDPNRLIEVIQKVIREPTASSTRIRRAIHGRQLPRRRGQRFRPQPVLPDLLRGSGREPGPDGAHAARPGPERGQRRRAQRHLP
ncbi:response regulator, partial [Staphylococcus aureus]|uniref:response regulator n=1 Tax=Staphylococcus aureus TaxID=1280 RepID=UPI003D7D989F